MSGDILAERASRSWKAPASLRAMAEALRCEDKALERALVDAGWHVDAVLIAWPPGQIEAFLLAYPEKAAERDEAINRSIRRANKIAPGGKLLPETTLYRDMLASLRP